MRGSFNTDLSDDTTPRWVTTTCSLDYSTTAVADKFGNLAIVRLPHNTNDDVTEDPTGTQSLWDRGLLSGASQKSDCVSVTHIGKICPPCSLCPHSSYLQERRLCRSPSRL